MKNWREKVSPRLAKQLSVSLLMTLRDVFEFEEILSIKN